MFLLLLKRFLRSRIALTGLLVVFIAGIISIYIGKQHMQKLEENMARTEHFQREHIERNVKYHDKEIGLLLYYIQFSLANQPHPLNALSIGQRDVNNSILRVTIRNLESQKYDTDLFNPSNLLAGNMDFGFVLIYLFPLLIIGFNYNLLSEEKEGGTWQLLSAQSAHPLKILLQYLAIRAFVVITLFIVLLLLAAAILSLPFDRYLLATTAIALLYLISWFAISFWVISLQRTSSTNAALLISAWMLLTLILPAAVNNYIIRAYPVPEALATVVEQREGYHEKWDMDKQITMDKFYAHYPQFRKYALPEKQFSWLWYYAMQQLGDDESRQHAAQMREKLWQREAASEQAAWFVPTLHAQHQLNTLARSGLSNHLHFLDSTTQFHEQLRLHFYPRIFGEAAVRDQDWNAFKVEHYAEEVRINWSGILAPFVSVAILFTVLGWVSYYRRAGITR